MRLFSEEIELPRKFYELLSDASICSNLKFIAMIKENSAQPVYIYNFVHLPIWKTNQFKLAKSFYSWVLRNSGLNMELGVTQGDELPFLFRLKVFGFKDDSFFNKTSKETEISQNMVRMFVNFAKVSNPTPNQGKMIFYAFYGVILSKTVQFMFRLYSAWSAYVSPYFYALQVILHCVTIWFGTLIKRMNTDLS